MSEQEFEVYLRLIARLLRLSDKQREAISDELRDHMEARLDELMDSGMGREQAIHAAVEEFGDAAGLADQFTRITRHYTLRRRIMRTSIGALAAAAAIALAFLFMLPQNRPGVSGPAESLAQEVTITSDAEGELSVSAGTLSIISTTEQSADTVRKLSQRISTDFQDTPLEMMVEYLRETTDVNIFVNWNQLESVGIDRDTLVSLHLKETSASTVLALLSQLLNPISTEPIDYAVMDDVVVISTGPEINKMRVVRIYDCLDMMNHGKSAQVTGMAQPNAAAGGMGMETNAGETRGAGRGGGYGGGGEFGGMGGYGEMGGYGGMGMGGGYGDFGSGYGNAYAGQGSNELINVVGTLLDNGGSVSTYDGMLVVVAGYKTHQRIQETLNLMREARARR